MQSNPSSLLCVFIKHQTNETFYYEKFNETKIKFTKHLETLVYIENDTISDLIHT